ncbi:hypothetical protein L596_023295 [Steinernema carpocapsae]|uniref:Fatty-acid and retinol-binding protein 1 n=1 Tax=Steinernema carpocapsae TaxID=34508 RepID=A0A4U5MD98_STECR|nr:hypothetical protein L596_023295 [Steinernema carpocapsae]
MVSKITVALVAGLAVAAFALPVPTEQNEKEFFDVLPDEVKNFYNSLTEADVKVFSELQSQLQGKDDTQAYEIIKSKNPELAERTKTLYQAIYNKMNTLSAAPKKYLTDLVSALENFNDAQLKAIIQQGTQLPKEAKDEIVKVFPTFQNFFKV